MKIVDAILEAKQAHPDSSGVVFAWWGNHAKSLRKLVEKLQSKYAAVRVRHVDHCNPAAMGDAFCKINHFQDINEAIQAVGGSSIDWLPTKSWLQSTTLDDSTRMRDFVTSTLGIFHFQLFCLV